jgi:hypothetical protein
VQLAVKLKRKAFCIIKQALDQNVENTNGMQCRMKKRRWLSTQTCVFQGSVTDPSLHGVALNEAQRHRLQFPLFSMRHAMRHNSVTATLWKI